jgi:hypothetical protein
MIMQNDISSKDVKMVYLSPSLYNNAFEEISGICKRAHQQLKFELGGGLICVALGFLK